MSRDSEAAIGPQQSPVSRALASCLVAWLHICFGDARASGPLKSAYREQADEMIRSGANMVGKHYLASQHRVPPV